MDIERLRSKLHDISKRHKRMNYWLQFDVRVLEKSNFGRRSEIAKELFPDVPPDTIELVVSSKSNFKKKLTNCFSQNADFVSEAELKKEINYILLTLDNILTDKAEYFQLDTEEDYHPTPGIFWQFWFIVLNRNGGKCVSISGSACD